MSLTVEQMEFLAERGLSLADVIEFARLGAGTESRSRDPESKQRSAGAIRTERYRAKKKAESDVTLGDADVTGCDAKVTPSDAVVTLGDGFSEKAPTLPLSPNDLISNPQTPTHPDIIPTREAVPFDGHVAAWQAWLAAKPKGGKRSASSDTPDRPDDVSEQVWSDFLKHRRKHRADLTATALAGFRREADRVGWSLERAIEESILRNWRGFKADWVQNNDRSGYGNSGRGAFAGDRQPRARTDGFTDAINDALASAGSGQATGPSGRWDDDYAAGDQGFRPARARVIR